MAFLSM